MTQPTDNLEPKPSITPIISKSGAYLLISLAALLLGLVDLKMELDSTVPSTLLMCVIVVLLILACFGVFICTLVWVEENV